MSVSVRRSRLVRGFGGELRVAPVERASLDRRIRVHAAENERDERRAPARGTRRARRRPAAPSRADPPAVAQHPAGQEHQHGEDDAGDDRPTTAGSARAAPSARRSTRPPRNTTIDSNAEHDRRERLRGAARRVAARGASASSGSLMRPTPPSSPRRRRGRAPRRRGPPSPRHDGATIGCRSPRARRLRGVRDVAVDRDRQPVRFGEIGDAVGVARRAPSPGAVANTCAATGASSATMPAASLSARTPSTTPHSSKSNDSRSAVASARAPCGLWAASTSTVGLDADELQPPGRGRLRESLGEDVAGDRLASAADERLDGGDREGGVEALVAAVERQILVVVGAGETPHRDQLPADGEALLGEREVARPRTRSWRPARRRRRAARPRPRHPAAPRRRRRRP